MERKELRIGNYLYDLGNKIVEVYGVNQDKIFRTEISFAFYYGASDLLQPIPLTEEWLQKLGFEVNKKNYQLNTYGEHFKYAIKEHFVIWNNPQKGWCVNELPHKEQYYIQYVHELQNLYFALTGKELLIDS